MVGFVIDRSFGRKAFGADPASYHSARPPYPDWVFATLVERCGLADGKSVFEIGPGTGTATRRLLDLGARPLIAIEPDPRLAAYLRSHNRDGALQVMVSTFEDAPSDERSACRAIRPLDCDGRHHSFTAGSVALGLMVTSHFGRVAERSSR